MPILKQLVSGASQTKRRSRLDLTTEMISAPLGDFRHTMHVGRGGDTFGDTSFLSSRSGEPPRAGDITPHSPRPSLLSRTFRSSKRSQSVTRVDRCENLLAPLVGSQTLVKNAFSLPHLNDEGGERGRESGGGVPKSLSSSPVDRPSEMDGSPANGVAALDPEQVERSFGELMALPSSSAPRGGAMRRTESVLSFHVDLGPSMLGDILDVMEKEDDSLGVEEGGASPPLKAPVEEGGVSPLLNAQDKGDEEEDNKEEDYKEEENGEEDNEEEENGEEDNKEENGEEDNKEENGEEDNEEEENGEEDNKEENGEEEGDSQEPILQSPITENMENPIKGPCAPETQATHPENHHLDTCSVSSSSSTPPEEMPLNQLQGGETDCTKYSPTQGEESSFSFMEEEDDEIRV